MTAGSILRRSYAHLVDDGDGDVLLSIDRTAKMDLRGIKARAAVKYLFYRSLQRSAST